MRLPVETKLAIIQSMLNRMSMVTGAALLTVFMFTGCSSDYGGGKYGDHEVDYFEPEEPLEDERDYEREGRWAYEERLEEYYGSQQQTGWTCHYDETWNNDWHDDVICSNGLESHRPYLLDWVDFVTYDDIMAAASEYEAYLNSQ